MLYFIKNIYYQTAMKNKPLERILISSAITSAALAAVFFALYFMLKTGFFLTAAITFAVIFYHFAMRLFIGTAAKGLLKKAALTNSTFFNEKPFEKHLYRFLHVKKWKDKMPTYRPEDFSLKHKSCEEIITETKISETGHEIMALLSFAPIFMSKYFGAFWVFFITSFSAALLDIAFVIIQRYNRPRLEKLTEDRRKN